MACDNAIVQVNEGDDFELVVTLTDKEGKTVDPLSLDWVLNYYVYPTRVFCASNKNGVLDSCSIQGNEIHLYVNGFCFGSGRLMSKIFVSFSNDNFKDGKQDVSSIPQFTNILIV